VIRVQYNTLRIGISYSTESHEWSSIDNVDSGHIGVFQASAWIYMF
jgi:hypothetical protein